jgi:thiazole biosynthesis-like protein
LRCDLKKSNHQSGEGEDRSGRRELRFQHPGKSGGGSVQHRYREIAQQTEQEVVEVETVSGFGANDTILDIRSVDEQDDKPLQVEGVEVVSLPFYKLSTQFGDLDQSKTYLLWCERGVMSRLQAVICVSRASRT